VVVVVSVVVVVELPSTEILLGSLPEEMVALA
jgi:hypothetical protein